MSSVLVCRYQGSDWCTVNPRIILPVYPKQVYSCVPDVSSTCRYKGSSGTGSRWAALVPEHREAGTRIHRVPDHSQRAISHQSPIDVYDDHVVWGTDAVGLIGKVQKRHLYGWSAWKRGREPQGVPTPFWRNNQRTISRTIKRVETFRWWQNCGY